MRTRSPYRIPGWGVQDEKDASTEGLEIKSVWGKGEVESVSNIVSW